MSHATQRPPRSKGPSYILDTSTLEVREICAWGGTFIDGVWISEERLLYRVWQQEQSYLLRILDVPTWTVQTLYVADEGDLISALGWTPATVPDLSEPATIPPASPQSAEGKQFEMPDNWPSTSELVQRCVTETTSITLPERSQLIGFVRNSEEFALGNLTTALKWELIANTQYALRVGFSPDAEWLAFIVRKNRCI